MSSIRRYGTGARANFSTKKTRSREGDKVDVLVFRWLGMVI